jgi:hypothetical protein
MEEGHCSLFLTTCVCHWEVYPALPATLPLLYFCGAGRMDFLFLYRLFWKAYIFWKATASVSAFGRWMWMDEQAFLISRWSDILEIYIAAFVAVC